MIRIGKVASSFTAFTVIPTIKGNAKGIEILIHWPLLSLGRVDEITTLSIDFSM